MDKDFKITLEAARVNVGKTQQDVATQIGVTRYTIMNWENGKIVPGVPQMSMLSKLYGVPIDNIFLPCYSTKSRKKDKGD